MMMLLPDIDPSQAEQRQDANDRVVGNILPALRQRETLVVRLVELANHGQADLVGVERREVLRHLRQ